MNKIEDDVSNLLNKFRFTKFSPISPNPRKASLVAIDLALKHAGAESIGYLETLKDKIEKL
jgi:hypothetical protein